MAHQLDSMAYNFTNSKAYGSTGSTPWHGLGVAVEGKQTIEQWIESAGLGWSIERTPVRYIDSNNDVQTMDDKHALYRSDTSAPLSVVSPRYQIVQPREIAEFFRDVSEANLMHIETLGALRGGRVIWALATNEANAFTLGSDDTVKAYTLLVTACDGTMATRAYTTSVRVVCNNTLQFSARDSSGCVSVSHSTKFEASTVKQKLGVNTQALNDFAGVADNLAHKSFSDTQLVNLVCDLYVKRDDKGNVKNERTLKSVSADIMQAFKSSRGANLSTAKGTAWGALNAVTNYIDYSSRSRNAENRFHSSQFGEGAKVKQNAMEMLIGNLETFQDIPRTAPESQEEKDKQAFDKFIAKSI